MPHTGSKILLIFPLITQLLFSLLSFIFSGFTYWGNGFVFLLATLPAFLFSLICYKQQYHQRNLIQIAFFSGTITFICTLITFSTILASENMSEPLSTWEHSLAVIFYAFMFALPAIAYAITVLRLFLPKK
ncbi:hypothetical protein [Glaesserella sp.]|uniref:hypothetical protein n=1 Tax=Glaesserella sp. TaxID=2094731 RepID=UPI0035A05EC3